MSLKEVKTRLKEAREAIRLKDFDNAAAHCRAVLELEETNYNALVFLGVSLEGMDRIDQALNAYKKATSECPNQPLAWQGMAAILDKDPSSLEVHKRVEVFEKLQSFTSGAEGKRISYLHKLVCLYMEKNSHEKAYETVKELLDLEKEGEGRYLACKAMVDLFSSQDLSEDETKYLLYDKCLNEVLNCASLSDNDVDQYTKLALYSKSGIDVPAISSKWKDLKERFPKASAPLECGIQMYLDQTIGKIKLLGSMLESVRDFCKELEDLSPNNEMVKNAHGVLAFHQNNYSQARDFLTGISTPTVNVHYYLCQTYLKLHDSSNCLKSCSKGLENCSNGKSVVFSDVTTVMDMFKLTQAEAHRQAGSEEDQKIALKILGEVEDRNQKEALLVKSYLFLDQGRLEEAESCCESLPLDQQVKLLKAIIYMGQQKYSIALPVLQDVLRDEPENATATLKKGVVLWELRESSEIENGKQQCFTLLLKAAKLDPYNYESFLYLGHFYKHIQKDPSKAIRCYRKSYDLNPTNDDAGCSYVDSLVDQLDHGQAMDILKAVTSKAPAGRAKWAWLRLGLHQMKHEDPSIAITSLQAALRADPKDNHVWECLSEAYLHRGSLTAALKAFTKASELNPESTYCFYQIANIRQTLGLLPEAVKDYRCVLEKEPSYVAALKGLGETLILLAKQNLNQCLDGLAQDNVEEALAVLTRAASQRPDFSCIWKLMGDSCTLVSCLASDSYRIPCKLQEKSSDSQSMTQVTKGTLLQIGSRCYSQAVKIMPQSSSLWHNLGVNLYNEACLLYQKNHQVLSMELLDRSRKSLENALRLEPKNWRHWNALGVIACSKVDAKLPFAQHCFIKSVECEANNVMAWSNLGILYLSHDNIQLAHDAFKVAQRLDPTYMAGWLGQALIAEVVGHEEAMDLFRHTTELGPHLESELGYGHQVLSMLRDETKQNTELFNFCIHRMAAIPAASDALIRYTTRVQNDPIAYNMLGLLLEHQKLFRPSVDAFASALKLLENCDNKEMECQVKMNYARALCSAGRHKEAMEQFQLIGSDLTVEHLIIYAFVAYKEGSYIDSFKLYKLALEQVSDDENLKSQVYAALAMVAFKVDDLDEAKTQLFNGFQTESPSLQGLLAMSALGLHQKDLTLATAALDELSKRSDTNEVVEKIAILTLYKHILEGSEIEGENFLKELIQSHPESTRKLWFVLASFLITSSSERSKDVLECIKTIEAMKGTISVSEAVAKTLAQLQAGQHSRHNIDANAFKMAQRAFHQNPGDASAIATMACAVHAEGVYRKLSTQKSGLFQMEKGLLSLLDEIKTDKNNLSLQTWFMKQLVVCCAELGNESEAREILSLLDKEEPDVETFVDAMTLFLYATPIDKWSKQQHLLSIMVICNLLAEEENDVSVINTLKAILENPEANEGNIPVSQILEIWTHTAFKTVQNKKLTGSEEMQSFFNQGLTLSEERQINSPVVSVIQGINNFRSNKRQSKHHFATALDQSEKRVGSIKCKSVARQGLVTLLADSTKDSDRNLIEALVSDAELEMDDATVGLYKKLITKDKD